MDAFKRLFLPFPHYIMALKEGLLLQRGGKKDGQASLKAEAKESVGALPEEIASASVFGIRVRGHRGDE